MYIPPENSINSDNDVMFDDISTIVALYGNKIILIGDFNSRTGEISDILEVDKIKK